jgi:hypothetical protein
MNFCALDDAFQEIGGAPSPGCATDTATKIARKEERKKARRCKGPPASYLDVEDKDPDRQHLNKLPDIPAMNPATGLREHVPVTAPQGSIEPYVNRNPHTHLHSQNNTNQENESSAIFHKDPLCEYVSREARGKIMVLPVEDNLFFTKPKS